MTADEFEPRVELVPDDDGTVCAAFVRLRPGRHVRGVYPAPGVPMSLRVDGDDRVVGVDFLDRIDGVELVSLVRGLLHGVPPLRPFDGDVVPGSAPLELDDPADVERLLAALGEALSALPARGAVTSSA